MILTSEIGGFQESFAAAKLISRINFTEKAGQCGDRPRHPAYEIFALECRF